MTNAKQEQPDRTEFNIEETLENCPEDCGQEEFSVSGEELAGEQLEEKTRQLDELADRYKRLQADFDNFRRRTVKEKESISEIVTERIVGELLPVMDNFERALDMSNSSNDAASLTLGMEMIFRQFSAALTRFGVEPIETLDCQFDPALHEAVARVADDTKPEGLIASQIQKGYKLRGKVIRHSMVNVVGD